MINTWREFVFFNVSRPSNYVENFNCKSVNQFLWFFLLQKISENFAQNVGPWGDLVLSFNGGGGGSKILGGGEQILGGGEVLKINPSGVTRSLLKLIFQKTKFRLRRAKIVRGGTGGEHFLPPSPVKYKMHLPSNKYNN